MKIGVVASCTYSEATTNSVIKVKANDKEVYSASVKGDARMLAGEICILDDATKELWLTKNPNLIFLVLGRISKLDLAVFSNDDLEKNIGDENCVEALGKVICGLCLARFGKEDSLRRHLNAVHSVAAVCFNGVANGFMSIKKASTDSVDVNLRESGNKGKDSGDELGAACCKDLQHILTVAISALVQEDGWASLGEVGSWLKKNVPSFDIRNYGRKKFRELVHALNYLEVYEKPQGADSAIVHIYVRVKLSSVKSLKLYCEQ